MTPLPALRVDRRPLDCIGPALTLLRATYRPLLRALLVYLGLPALLAAVGIGAFYGNLLGDLGIASAPSGAPDVSFGFVQVVALLVGAAALVAVTGAFALVMAVWMRQVADGETPTAEGLWDEARTHAGPMARLMVLLLAGSVVGVVAFVLLIALAALTLVLVLPAVLGGMAFALLLSAVVLVSVQAMVSEGLGARASVARAWHLLTGVRGATMLLMFMLWLLATAVTYAFMIPFYALVFAGMAFGGEQAMADHLGWMGYGMGIVVVVFGLVPYLLYYAVTGVLYYGRVEALEHVGFEQDMNALLDAFPSAPDAAQGFSAQTQATTSGAAFSSGPPPLRTSAPPADTPAPSAPPTASPPAPLPGASPADAGNARWRPSAPPPDAV